MIHFYSLGNQASYQGRLFDLTLSSMTLFFMVNLGNTMTLQAVERAAGAEGQKITYNVIKQRLGDLIYRLVYVLVLF